MWRIAHNLRVDTIRRLQFRNHKSLDVPVHEEGASESAVDRVEDKQDIGSERKTDGARFMEAVESAIPELEPDQREVFVLRQLQGLSFQEIADVQEVNVNTVKSRMRYALQRLRQILEEYAPQKAEAP
jgi:RNA polymerase sigma-70 factor (ECF subfamily)